MNHEISNALQPLLDKIAEIAEKQLASEELHRLIGELGNLVGKGKIASVNLLVDVFDEDRQCSLPLLTTGLCAYPGKNHFGPGLTRHRRGMSLKTVSGLVPHDRCPVCWQSWDFKWKNSSCLYCGFARSTWERGKDVTITPGNLS